MPKVVHVKSAHKPRPGKTHHVCEQCSVTILPRTSYKHVTVKTSPRSSHTRYRCDKCPIWHPWELSSALWARLAEIGHNFQIYIYNVETQDDVESVLSNTAEEIRAIAEEKRESASNIEDGFGHPTSTSEELSEIADNLDSWANDIEDGLNQCPDYPDAEKTECEECIDGDLEDGSQCNQCEGTGLYTPDEPSGDQVDEWREDVINTLTTMIDDAPVG